MKLTVAVVLCTLAVLQLQMETPLAQVNQTTDQEML